MRADTRLALYRQIEELAASRRRERFASFDNESLAWLVLPPVWPAAVVDHLASAHPALPTLLDEAVRAGLCVRQGASDDPDRRWAVEPEQRASVLDELRSRGRGELLRGVAREIGSRILQSVGLAGPDGDRSPPTPESIPELVPADSGPLQGLVKWAVLADSAGGRSTPGATLRNAIEHLVKPLDPVGSRTGEALAWLDMGGDLAQALGGELETAVILARRRVELTYRRAFDSRHLERLIERHEQVAAFEDLISGVREEWARGEPDPDAAWALHYLGVGGVGKTMLIRHIVVNLAPRAGILTTRVDFDHLKPDFPALRPGQLLLELTEELRAYSDSSTSERIFQEFGRRIVELHEALTTDRAPDEPLAALRDSRFERALSAFCDLLRSLGRPVLFILDTCEELAKLQPAGGRIPPLEATLWILERIRARVPGTRVVFAGRRLLVRRGRGWSLPVEPGAAGHEVRGALPDEKPYLRLHLIRGFDRDEAERYLDGVPELARREGIRSAILSRSPDPGIPPGLPVPDHAGDRFNPFDLALYSDWVREDPDMDEGVIAAGDMDPYVEVRIVRRLENQPAVQRLIPAAVLLRRFDGDALRPAFPGDDEEFVSAFRELAEQEWIQYQTESDQPMLEVDRNLLPRLESFYHHDDRRHAVAAAADRIAEPLAMRLLEEPFELNVDAVDAALRLLPPPRAAEVVQELTMRVAEAGRWGWAANVARTLLGPGGAGGDPESPLRAAIRALHNSALLHIQPATRLAAEWAEVEGAAPFHPHREIGDWLSWRARFGQLSALAHAPASTAFAALADGIGDAVLPTPPDADPAVTEQLTASAVAALMALVDPLELRFEQSAEGAADTHRAVNDPAAHRAVGTVARILFGMLDETQPSESLEAWARLTLARARRFAPEAAPELQTAPELALDALAEIADRVPDESPAERWLDLAIPRAMRGRFRLEVLRLLRRAGIEGEIASSVAAWHQRVDRWLSEAISQPYDADRDLLASQALLAALDFGTVAAGRLRQISLWEDYAADSVATGPIAGLVPPLFSTLALAWGAVGELAEAETVLRDGRNVAERSRRGTIAVTWADRVHLVLGIRYRLPPDALNLSQDTRADYDYGRLQMLTRAGRHGGPASVTDRPRTSFLLSPFHHQDDVEVEFPRRRALLLLESAELRAVRRPAEAVADLDRAWEAFMRLPAGEDFLGAFQACLLSGLASLRSGDVEAAPARVARVRGTWEELSRQRNADAGSGSAAPPKASGSHWPEWDTFESPSLDERERFPLGPAWYDRLTTFCSAAMHPPTGGLRELAVGRLSQFLETEYGRQLPAELDLVGGGEEPFAVGAAAAAADAPPAPSRDTALRKFGGAFRDIAAEGGFGLVGLGIITTAFYYIARAVGYEPGPFPSMLGGVATLVALVLGLLAAQAFVPAVGAARRRVAARVESLLISRGYFEVLVQFESNPDPDTGVQVNSRLEPESYLARVHFRRTDRPSWWPRATQRERLSIANVSLTEPADPGRLLGRTLDNDLAAGLRDTVDRLDRRQALLPIQVGSGGDWIPWEEYFATLIRGNPPSTTSLPSLLGYRRVILRSGQTGEAADGTWGARVAVIGDHNWFSIPELAWRSAGFEPEGIDAHWAASSGATRIVTDLAAGVLPVLHVVGEPITTSGGIRLRYGFADSLTKIVRQARTEIGGGGQDRLLAAEQLPDAWLTVVQGEPTGELSFLQTEREQLADLRSFCAQLAYGVSSEAPWSFAGRMRRAVFVLPSLPFAVASEAVSALATHLPTSGNPPGLPTLVEALSRAQQAILTTPVDDRTTTWEGADARQALALGCTLFYRD